MPSSFPSQSHWLRSYYYARTVFSVAWVAGAILAADNAFAVALLLVLYPAWDAVANFVDARVSGGLAANRSQSLNVIASALTAVVVALAILRDMHSVLAVFGIWAGLSGLAQLVTGLRRRRSEGAQWAMILSGGQSVLAGAHMIQKSLGAAAPSITDIAPYAAFGAFYFLLSALWLTVAAFRGSGKVA
ncbi:membrane protein [Aureimonas endophytica]|uniref:Membrane protein n=1 Tax=Aureimonas endophytica TaxID=2027858 RepID=A0A916ZMB0_9HYPH|nr:DUF308 domain-containing protein [Aureimonas endophytica]GGE04610.1 membrane protein [Aureimonas endophytica]